MKQLDENRLCKLAVRLAFRHAKFASIPVIIPNGNNDKEIYENELRLNDARLALFNAARELSEYLEDYFDI